MSADFERELRQAEARINNVPIARLEADLAAAGQLLYQSWTRGPSIGGGGGCARTWVLNVAGCPTTGSPATRPLAGATVTPFDLITNAQIGPAGTTDGSGDVTLYTTGGTAGGDVSFLVAHSGYGASTFVVSGAACDSSTTPSAFDMSNPTDCAPPPCSTCPDGIPANVYYHNSLQSFGMTYGLWPAGACTAATTHAWSNASYIFYCIPTGPGTNQFGLMYRPGCGVVELFDLITCSPFLAVDTYDSSSVDDTP